jgi:MFS family permease
VLQTLVDEDKRGRVMSFFTMAFFGTVPFGSLFSGVVADRFGAPGAIAIGGVACIVGSMLFLRALPNARRLARPVYVKLGILQDLADE